MNTQDNELGNIYAKIMGLMRQRAEVSRDLDRLPKTIKEIDEMLNEKLKEWGKLASTASEAVDARDEQVNAAVSLTDEERKDLDRAMFLGGVITFRGKQYRRSESYCSCVTCALRIACYNQEQGVDVFCRRDKNHNFVEVKDDKEPATEDETEDDEEKGAIAPEEWAVLDDAIRDSSRGFAFRGKMYQVVTSEGNEELCAKCALTDLCPSMKGNDELLCRKDGTGKKYFKLLDTAPVTSITPEEQRTLDDMLECEEETQVRKIRGKWYKRALGECDDCALQELCDETMLTTSAEILCDKDEDYHFVEAPEVSASDTHEVVSSPTQDARITPEEVDLLDFLHESKWGCKARIRGKVYRLSEWDEGNDCDTCDLRQLCNDRNKGRERKDLLKYLCHKNPSKNFKEVKI